MSQTVWYNWSNILQEMHTYALQNNIPVIDDPTRQYIEKILNEIQPTHCLEIGSAIWYSTACIAQQIAKWWWKIIWCEYSFPSYMKSLYFHKKVSLTNSIIYYGDFIKFSKQFFPRPFDFIFIDAKKDLYKDFYIQVLNYAAPNATIIFDDVVKYENKTQNLREYLHKTWVSYTTHQLWEDDGIIHVTT